MNNELKQITEARILRIKGIRLPLWVAAISLAIIALGVIVFIIGVISTQNQITGLFEHFGLVDSEPNTSHIKYLKSNNPIIYVPIDKWGLYEIPHASQSILNKAENLGNIFRVDNGTAVEILNQTDTIAEIVIISGPQYGRKGFVFLSWLE